MLRRRLSNFFNGKPLLGLDLGSDALRLLELQKTARGFRVEKLINEKLCAEALEEGMVFNWAGVKEQLSSIVSEANLSGYSAAIALPQALVMRKQIQLPAYFKPEELEAELKSRLREYFPGMLSDEVLLDFIIETTKNEMHHLQLFVVRQAHIQPFLDVLRQAGLKIKIIDLDIYARARAGSWYCSHQPRKQSEALMLIDLHWPFVSFLFFQGSEFSFHYSSRLKDLDSHLSQEIMKARDLAQAACAGLKLGRIVICGDVSEQEKLLSELAGSISLPIQPISLFSEMECSLENKQERLETLSSGFLLCCGLAMRSPAL